VCVRRWFCVFCLSVVSILLFVCLFVCFCPRPPTPPPSAPSFTPPTAPFVCFKPPPLFVVACVLCLFCVCLYLFSPLLCIPKDANQGIERKQKQPNNYHTQSTANKKGDPKPNKRGPQQRKRTTITKRKDEGRGGTNHRETRQTPQPSRSPCKVCVLFVCLFWWMTRPRPVHRREVGLCVCVVCVCVCFAFLCLSRWSDRATEATKTGLSVCLVARAQSR
jgi:hypothetical protein